MSDVFREGEVAVVTGAALGIGRAAATRMEAAGMRVVRVDLPGPDFDAMAANAAGLCLADDLADPNAIERIKKAVTDAHGAPHLLMNNAASHAGRGDAPLADWHQAMSVNFWAPVALSRAFVPDMQAAGGARRVINVGSKQGITNPPGHTIYNVTKSAIKTYTEALEHELRAAEGPRVTAHLLIPGWTTTGHAEPNPGAWMPGQVIDFMEEKLGEDAFYILCPDGEVTTEMDHKRIRWGAGDITEGRPPLSRWDAAWKDKAREECS